MLLRCLMLFIDKILDVYVVKDFRTWDGFR